MRFIATYASIKPSTALPYYRTIDADTQHEATKLAERMQRKGFRLVKMEQQLGKE